MEHFTEAQIDAMVFELRFTEDTLGHFFDCDECFIAWRRCSDLVSALRKTCQFARNGLPLELRHMRNDALNVGTSHCGDLNLSAAR